MKLKPKYSGDLSRDFWLHINTIKRKKYRYKAYELGCVLQNIEDEILSRIEQHINEGNRNKP